MAFKGEVRVFDRDGKKSGALAPDRYDDNRLALIVETLECGVREAVELLGQYFPSWRRKVTAVDEALFFEPDLSNSHDWDVRRGFEVKLPHGPEVFVGASFHPETLKAVPWIRILFSGGKTAADGYIQAHIQKLDGELAASVYLGTSDGFEVDNYTTKNRGMSRGARVGLDKIVGAMKMMLDGAQFVEPARALVLSGQGRFFEAAAQVVVKSLGGQNGL